MTSTGDGDEKGQTGFKGRGRNSGFAPRAEKDHRRDQRREGRGGGWREFTCLRIPSSQVNCPPAQRTSVQRTSLQYLFLSVLVHVPFIKTLVPEEKIPFSVNNQVCSPRPPARLSGTRGLQTPELALGAGLVGSDGGLCVFKSLLETGS